MKFLAGIFDKKYKTFKIFVLIFQEKLHTLTEFRRLEGFVWKLQLPDLKNVTVVFPDVIIYCPYSAKPRLPNTFNTVSWPFLFEGSAGSREYLQVIYYWSCYLNGKSSW